MNPGTSSTKMTAGKNSRMIRTHAHIKAPVTTHPHRAEIDTWDAAYNEITELHHNLTPQTVAESPAQDLRSCIDDSRLKASQGVPSFVYPRAKRRRE